MTDSGELDIIPAVKDSLAEFFARILSMEVSLSEAAPSLLIEGSGFRGRIGISGEKQGHADILVSDDYAALMAASMLGASVAEVEIDHEVPDLLLEMADFMSKRLRQCLEDSGFACEFSEPDVQVEENFAIQPRLSCKPLRIVFKHQEYIGLLEIYLEDGDTTRTVDAKENQAAQKQADRVPAAAESKFDELRENEAAGDAPAEDEDPESDGLPEPRAVDGSEKRPEIPVQDTGDDTLSVELELEPIDDDDLHELLGTSTPPTDDETASIPGVLLAADGAASSTGLETVPVPGEGTDTKASDEQKLPRDDETLPVDNAAGPSAAEADGGTVHEQAADSYEFQGLSAENLADLSGEPHSDAHMEPFADETVLYEKGAAADEPGGQSHARRESIPKDAGRQPSLQKVPAPGKVRKRYCQAAVLGCTLLLLAVAVHFLRRPIQERLVIQHAKAPVAVVRQAMHTVSTEPKKMVPAAVKAEPPSPGAALQHKLAEAQRLREKILAKQDDILSLEQYFENAIYHQRDQIRQQLQKDHIRSFQQAANNEELALALRTIQRQSASVQALQEPLEWLGSAGEALDYGIRKTRIDFQMAPYTRGADLKRLTQFTAGLIRKYTINDERLLMNVHQVAPVPVKAIWKDIAAGIEKAAWVQNTDAATESVRPNLGQWLVNRKIWRQICHGDYHRKSNLTMISAQAAACLSQDKVRELFLDSLEELPAAAAYHLARWPGDWLAINGITALSAAAAQQLAKWKGQRLSLNGLETLSPQAAGFLSRWRGRQLELVSLSITNRDDARQVISALKHWMGSGGKLFVSRKMRRKIEAADR